MKRIVIALLLSAVTAFSAPPEPRLVRIQDEPRCRLMLGDPKDNPALNEIEKEALRTIATGASKDEKPRSYGVYVFRGRPGHAFALVIPLRKGECEIYEWSSGDPFSHAADVSIRGENRNTPIWKIWGTPFFPPPLQPEHAVEGQQRKGGIIEITQAGTHVIEVRLRALPADIPEYPVRSHFVVVSQYQEGQQDAGGKRDVAPPDSLRSGTVDPALPQL